MAQMKSTNRELSPGRSLTGAAGFAVLALLITACGEEPSPPNSAGDVWSDESPHEEGYVMVNGVRLQYLDWGGTGDGLVLIPGSGNPPHVYDEIAPQFTDQFRVLSYARRGDVRSEDAGPYDVDTMVEDLRQFLDHFGITKAHLVGWSLGGYELTRFAGLYPERVGKLVYLDAGYDWYADANLFSSMPSETWPPSENDLASIDAYATWFTEESIRAGIRWSSSAVQAYARDYLVMDSAGKLSFLSPDSVGWARRDEDRAPFRPDYAAVAAPALGIYVSEFRPTVGDSAQQDAIRSWTEGTWRPFATEERRKFETQLRGAETATLSGGNHMSFILTHGEELVGLMRAFLLRETGKPMP